MPKYDVPVIVQVDTDNIDVARQKVHALLEELAGDRPAALINVIDHDKIKFAIANDEQRIRDGRRIVILHPDDTDSGYDPNTYKSKETDDDD